MRSSFAAILRSAVQKTPGAIGGAFAAADGVLVDAFANLRSEEWAILAAHYGVLLAHVQAALSTFHYGEAQTVLLVHRQMDILMQPVGEGYYALLALDHPAPLARAFSELSRVADEIRQELYG